MKTTKRDVIALVKTSTTSPQHIGILHEIQEYCQEHGYEIERTVEYSSGPSLQKEFRKLRDLARNAEGEQVKKTLIFGSMSHFGTSISGIMRRINEFAYDCCWRLEFVHEGVVLDRLAKGFEKEALSCIVKLHNAGKEAKQERKNYVDDRDNKKRATGAKPLKLRSKLDRKEEAIKRMVEKNITQKAIAEKVGCTEATLSNWLKRKRKIWDSDN